MRDFYKHLKIITITKYLCLINTLYNDIILNEIHKLLR